MAAGLQLPVLAAGPFQTVAVTNSNTVPLALVSHFLLVYNTL